jgi:hypothetical protein
MVEELEFMICDEAIKNVVYLETHNLSVNYNPNYFKEFVTGPLFENYFIRLREKIDHLSNEDAWYFIKLSYNQFFSHTPDIRQYVLYDKFWSMMVFPEKPLDKMDEYYMYYLDLALVAYKIHFFRFANLTEKVLKEYESKVPLSKRINITEVEISLDLEKLFPNSNTSIKKGIETFFNIPLKNDTKTTRPIAIAYTYLKNDQNYNAIADLYDTLVKNEFISESTDKKDFRRIFENTKPQRQINWIGSISDLHYFIKVIHKHPSLIYNLSNNIWKVTAQLFIDKNNRPFEWQKFKGLKKPARASILENAVALLN